MVCAMYWIPGMTETINHSPPILEVDGLNVTFPTMKEPFRAVKDVSFHLGQERLGIVGESGSGKSTIAKAILHILGTKVQVSARSLCFEGWDILSLNETQMRKLRGQRIAMIMQDPRVSLNPVIRLGDQVAEPFRIHGGMSKSDSKRHALEMLDTVRIPDPGRVYDLYPHEVSGGMGQRIMIAMMLALKPRLLIADEPTSALDAAVAVQIMSLLDELVDKHGLSLMLISHDLRMVDRFCDRVLVMKGGEIVDQCQSGTLGDSTHPYTRRLLGSIPRLGKAEAQQ